MFLWLRLGGDELPFRDAFLSLSIVEWGLFNGRAEAHRSWFVLSAKYRSTFDDSAEMTSKQ